MNGPGGALLMTEAGKPVEGAGQRALLERFYRDHRVGLVARLRKVFGPGPPSPEDLAQSAFARLAAMDDLSAIRNPKALLFRIALNFGFDQLDKQAVSQRLYGSYKIYTEHMQIEAPETVYLEEERLDQIHKLIDTLPDSDRELLRRCRLKGESLSAIAAEKNVSVSTLSRRLAKVLADLKLRLEEDGQKGRDRHD